jgi:hypothetical protein|tara:strand:+ start:1054 stop:1296 length:243 start_codon:yes stop_codon:yes gene_type:complete
MDFSDRDSMLLIGEALEVAKAVEGDESWKLEQQMRIMWSMLQYSKTHSDLPLDIILRMSLNDWELDHDRRIYPAKKDTNQ